LESARWAGCIDAVGGKILARVLTQMKPNTTVAAVGNAGGNALPTTVIPFLLRGVGLIGIDSASCPYARRVQAWARIASDLPTNKLSEAITIVGLADVPGHCAGILEGRIQGRVLVDVNA
jgi:acrylyl-CoA reductase (NADPH)